MQYEARCHMKYVFLWYQTKIFSGMGAALALYNSFYCIHSIVGKIIWGFLLRTPRLLYYLFHNQHLCFRIGDYWKHSHQGHHNVCWWPDFTGPPTGTLVKIEFKLHYVRMGAMASQITSLTIVYSTVYSGADQSKHQSSASLAFVWGIHRGPVNSPHKWPVTRKMFPFDDVIMIMSSYHICMTSASFSRYEMFSLFYNIVNCVWK